MVLAAESTAPSGGAAFDEILIAAALITVTYLPLGWFLFRETAGRTTLIGRAADALADRSGMARWAALPLLIGFVAVFVAGFGVYWDVPIHVQVGRDEGPLANPSHYPILFALMACLGSGVISAGLAGNPTARNNELPARTIRLSKRWEAPMATFVMLAAGLIAMLGFPLDDLWHRLFGQDVTEWGPTHVMMIGGAVTWFICAPLLIAESVQAGRPPRFSPRLLIAFFIGFNAVATAFLMEFDLGIPQFPATTLFIISGVVTGWLFVASRLWLGPGGALVAWLVYVIVRVGTYVIVLPVPDIHHARFLLYLGAAVCIEAVMFVVKARGPWVAALAGLVGGSLGLASEWPWMSFFMPFPLPPDTGQMPLLLTVGAIAGAGGGLVGWAMVDALSRVSGMPSEVTRAPATDPVSGRWAGTIGTAAFVLLMAGFAVPTSVGEVEVVKECEGDTCRTSYVPESGEPILGTVTYDDPCIGREGCTSRITVQLDPVDAAEDAVWISVISYQGLREEDPSMPGNGLLTTEMLATDVPGEYRSAEPLAFYGGWKTFVRLHLAPRAMVALPLHMPADEAIDTVNSGLVEAADGSTHPFIYEPLMLQRERKPDVPLWLWTAMYAVVVALWLALLVVYGWLYTAAARAAQRGASSTATRRTKV